MKRQGIWVGGVRWQNGHYQSIRTKPSITIKSARYSLSDLSMKIVEISVSLGNGLKRYNVFDKVSMSKQPFKRRESILYGVTKPTDIVQTNEPTNMLIGEDDNPTDNSEPVYFGIRVYPFISADQQFSCNNNIISYGELFGLDIAPYFPTTSVTGNRALLPDPYIGQLYPQPEFVETISKWHRYTTNYEQAMQQFVNDCVFPTKPNLDIPGQSLSTYLNTSKDRLGTPYFNPEVVVLSELKQKEPRGILSDIKDVRDSSRPDYMVQFDGQNLNFKFGMAVNSDFTEPPKIYLPYLYRTYCALYSAGSTDGELGLIMQCLLYDSNGNVISA